ncbi:MAG: hypothetical protein P4M13_08235 [Alphaproteobacteria bacterium]|nr:hypothetical protein [Alphaproteobacteria bacterium]
MNDDPYKAYIKGRSKGLTSPVARLMISVGQSYHECEKLKAAVELINRTPSIQLVHVSINDFLQRHTLVLMGYPDKHEPSYFVVPESLIEEASKISIQAGISWRDRNKDILSQIQPAVHFTRWKTWLNKPEFVRAHKAILNLVEMDGRFGESVLADALRYLGGRQKAGLGISPRMLTHCRDYLLEELAVFAVQCRILPATELYPGENLCAAEYLKKLGKTLPPSLQSLATRDFARIDFKRVNISSRCESNILPFFRKKTVRPFKPDIFVNHLRTWILEDPKRIEEDLQIGEDGCYKGAEGIKIRRKNISQNGTNQALSETEPFAFEIFPNHNNQTLWKLARGCLGYSPAMRAVTDSIDWRIKKPDRFAKERRSADRSAAPFTRIDADPYAEAPPLEALTEAIKNCLLRKPSFLTFPILNKGDDTDPSTQDMPSFVHPIIDRVLEENGFPKKVRDAAFHLSAQLPEWRNDKGEAVACASLLKVYFAEDVHLFFYGDRFHPIDSECIILADDKVFVMANGEPSQISRNKLIVSDLDTKPVFLFDERPSERMAFVSIKAGTPLNVDCLFEFTPDFVGNGIEKASANIEALHINGSVARVSLTRADPRQCGRASFAPDRRDTIPRNAHGD